MRKLLTLVSFAACIYLVAQWEVNHLAFMGCYLFFCWNAWAVLDGNEKPGRSRTNRYNKYY